MKILFQSRKTLYSVPGGDTVQMNKTKEYLEKIGVEVDITTDLTPNLEKYDIVHVFNLMRPQEVFLQVLNAKRQKKKIALSTIYGFYTEYDKKARGGLAQIAFNLMDTYTIETLKVIMRAIKNREFHEGTIQIFRNGYYKTLKLIAENVDVFLPNSDSEMQRVKNDLKLKDDILYYSVPNAVDTKLFDYENTELEEAEKFKDCVLCVARIEGRKSQLNLVRAMKKLPYKLVLIGKSAPNHIKYFEQIKKEAGENTTIINHLDHKDLPKYYKAAKVHALISWMETPGLASLEAGIMRCNLVITKKGDTFDYFRDYAEYCEPDDINSIEKAIKKAYESPVNLELSEYIKENYSWEKTAQITFEAYNKILS